jgi:phosphoesterase RecJ-like protein
MSIDAVEWTRAVEALSGARSVALACHVGPDGDALGSMLALGLALRARGTEVVASWGSDPFEVPRQYRFLPGLDLLVPPDRFPERPAVMATFDAGSMDRLGSLVPNARAAGALIVCDHHVSNDRFGSINLVAPDAAASAVIVFDLLGRLDVKLDADAATCLYTGLVTDTGRFQYKNTTPAVHAIAADLIAAGAPHDKITEIVYNTHPVGYLRLAAAALGRLEVRPEASLVWTWVTQEDLTLNEVTMDDIEGLIDLVRTADVADVAAVLKEQPDGRYKVSMRSKGGSNVGALCEAMGGGGHALAAGFTADGSDARATIGQIVDVLRS